MTPANPPRDDQYHHVATVARQSTSDTAAARLNSRRLTPRLLLRVAVASPPSRIRGSDLARRGGRTRRLDTRPDGRGGGDAAGPRSTRRATGRSGTRTANAASPTRRSPSARQRTAEGQRSHGYSESPRAPTTGPLDSPG